MILIWANYRSGSTSLLLELCEQHNFNYSDRTGELFGCNNSAEWPLENPELYDDYVIKCIPDQMQHYNPQLIVEYRQRATREIYCLRDDMTAQTKSLLCAQYVSSTKQGGNVDLWHSKGDLVTVEEDVLYGELNSNGWWELVDGTLMYNWKYLREQILSENVQDNNIVWLEQRTPLEKPYTEYIVNSIRIKNYLIARYGTDSYREYIQQKKLV